MYPAQLELGFLVPAGASIYAGATAIPDRLADTIMTAAATRRALKDTDIQTLPFEEWCPRRPNQKQTAAKSGVTLSTEKYPPAHRERRLRRRPSPGSHHGCATFEVMPEDRSTPPDPDQPTSDDPLAGLRKLAGLAKELGVTDVANFTEALDAARNEGRGAELFKPLKALVEQFSGQNDSSKSFSDLGGRIKEAVRGRETVAEMQYKVETALLRRIEELSGTAPIEGLVDLATAYARVRSASFARGEETPPPH